MSEKLDKMIIDAIEKDGAKTTETKDAENTPKAKSKKKKADTKSKSTKGGITVKDLKKALRNLPDDATIFVFGLPLENLDYCEEEDALEVHLGVFDVPISTEMVRFVTIFMDALKNDQIVKNGFRLALKEFENPDMEGAIRNVLSRIRNIEDTVIPVTTYQNLLNVIAMTFIKSNDLPRILRYNYDPGSAKEYLNDCITALLRTLNSEDIPEFTMDNVTLIRKLYSMVTPNDPMPETADERIKKEVSKIIPTSSLTDEEKEIFKKIEFINEYHDIEIGFKPTNLSAIEPKTIKPSEYPLLFKRIIPADFDKLTIKPNKWGIKVSYRTHEFDILDSISDSGSASTITTKIFTDDDDKWRIKR